MEIEIGIGKTARRAYGFDEVAIVPSRRTRDPDDIDISWEIDAFRFQLPLAASAMVPGMRPSTPAPAGVAPFRWTTRRRPSCSSIQAKLWWFSTERRAVAPRARPMW